MEIPNFSHVRNKQHKNIINQALSGASNAEKAVTALELIY
ncbi:hypothetical protein CPS_3109 [Colwellia psychrerythraea 34H]|uniref:Uncharacterized protein n=1 Tax=Colwellia psychrerythraea (strain 34H / ATCC BAA-681) TaxID=167879 RepID=Q47ZG3_COLP3|nr:hypothetical protein CPS_3109 [Colwellia psychrerythraea 34H]